MKRQPSIVLLTTAGLADFVQNTVQSIALCGIDTLSVHIFHTKEAEPELRRIQQRNQVHLRCLEEEFPEQSPAHQLYMEFGTEAFGSFTLFKWLALQRVLSEGAKSVIYSDVDICWRRDPIPYLRTAIKMADIAVQHEGDEAVPFTHCTGFMCFRRSLFSAFILRRLLRTQRKMLLSQPSAHDQIVFNEVVLSSFHRRRLLVLPNLLFPSGLLEGYFQAVSPRSTTGPNTPMIFHANWVVGLAQKRELLIRTGHWLV